MDWLVGETVSQPYLDNLFADLCGRLRAAGVPLGRATMHLRTLHPQFQGARVLWRPDLAGPELNLLEHGVFDDPRFVNSPVKALYEGADGFRQRLDLPPDARVLEYGIYADLRQEGYTDYVALPMQFTDGRRHATSWSTHRPGGFSTEDLVEINDLLPVLALAVEIRANRRITKNLLNTYVGQHAGERILSGDIRRGSGATVRAAIWNCDLRGFTRISEQWPRDDVIQWLNEYFDVMAAPVEKHGGEVLKFVGDGMLAIFPLDSPEACNSALQAAVEARHGMRELNARRVARGSLELGFGVALHVGDVMYGNIGTATRLDFTVIGPAVNVTSRLQTLTKELRRQVLLSAPFAFLCGCTAEFLTTLGRFPLRGVDEPIEVFGLSAER
jgi:adenylate cyclase